MTEEDRRRDERIREQLRQHVLPEEWARELGTPDGDAMLLMTWLEVLTRRVHAAHLLEVRREHLTYSEAKLLYYLLLAGPPYHQSPTRLNENLELTSGGITKTVDRLVARGLVEWTAVPETCRTFGSPRAARAIAAPSAVSEATKT